LDPGDFALAGCPAVVFDFKLDRERGSGYKSLPWR